MKKTAIVIALLCSTMQVFAHSSGKEDKKGCHQHAPTNAPHCH